MTTSLGLNKVGIKQTSRLGEVPYFFKIAKTNGWNHLVSPPIDQ